MLERDPKKRITAEIALSHPYLSEFKCVPSSLCDDFEINLNDEDDFPDL